MSTPIEQFKTKLGIGQPGAPTIMGQGQSQANAQTGQAFLDKLNQRKQTGDDFYNSMKQQNTSRLASKLVDQSAGLKTDEFGKPNITLNDFGTSGQSMLKGITQHGNLATQVAENRNAYKNAVLNQNLGGYGLSGDFSVSGTAMPGATSNNPGARVASIAMQAAKNHTNYVWGGNSLSTGVDCSGLAQQAYRQVGVNIPRTTYEQAKNGHQVPISQIRPGDLVFYNNYGHVGIYVGNGHIVHAANSRLGVITSNLNNSNGSPLLVLRPY